MEKANERAGHLMVCDYRRTRPRATPEELQVRCRPLRSWAPEPCNIGCETQWHKSHYLTLVLNAGGGNDPVESAHACCHW